MRAMREGAIGEGVAATEAWMICPACDEQGQPSRECSLCGEAGCRHEMRKGQVRVDGWKWNEEVICKDPFACIGRHAKRVIR